VDWNARYLTQDIPWDKGEPHPVLPIFLSKNDGLFSEGKKHTLVPGCGYGHDLSAIAPHSHHITGLDISEEAILKASQLYPQQNISWELGDFFRWHSEKTISYDVIWEHTCFCAISPEKRENYARSASQLLRPGGYLCGIFFLNPNMPPGQGPPFGVTRDELHAYFDPYFQLLWDHPPEATYSGREHRETMMLWQLK